MHNHTVPLLCILNLQQTLCIHGVSLKWGPASEPPSVHYSKQPYSKPASELIPGTKNPWDPESLSPGSTQEVFHRLHSELGVQPRHHPLTLNPAPHPHLSDITVLTDLPLLSSNVFLPCPCPAPHLLPAPRALRAPGLKIQSKKHLASSQCTSGLCSPHGHTTQISQESLGGDFLPVRCIIKTTLNLLGNSPKGALAFSTYNYPKLHYGFAYRSVSFHWKVNFKRAETWSIVFPTASPVPTALAGTWQALSR